MTVWQHEHCTLVAPRIYINRVWQPPQTNWAISVPVVIIPRKQNMDWFVIKMNYKLERAREREEWLVIFRKYQEVELQSLHYRQHSTQTMLPQDKARDCGSPSKQAGFAWLKPLKGYSTNCKK